MTERILSDLKSIAELTQRALEGGVAHGSTVEVAMDNGELQTWEAVEALIGVLGPLGVRLVRTTGLTGSAIYLYPPGSYPEE